MAFLHSLIKRLLQVCQHRVTQNIFWMGAIVGVQSVRNLVLLMISARILGPEEFGVLAIIMGTCAFLYGLVNIPNNDVITTFLARSMVRGEAAAASAILRMAFLVTQGMALVACMLVVVCALAGRGLIGLETDHVLALLVYALADFCIVTQHDSQAALRLANHLHLALLASLASLLVQTTALLAVWQWGGGLLEITLAVLTGAAIIGSGQFAAVLWASRKSALPALTTGRIAMLPRDIFHFQLLGFAQTKTQILHEHLPILLLGAMAGPVHAGAYRAARQIANFPLFALHPVQQSTYTEYSQRWHAGGSFGRLPQRTTLLLTGLAILIAGLLFLLYPWIIPIVLGPGYENVSGPLLAMLPGICICISVSALHILPLAMGRGRPLLVWKVTALAVQLLVLLLLLPRHQALGAAWAYTAYYLVFAAMVISFSVTTLWRKGDSVQKPT